MLASVALPILAVEGEDDRVAFYAAFYQAYDGFEPRGAGVEFANPSFSQTPDMQSLLVLNRSNIQHGAQANITASIMPLVEYELSMWVRMAAGSQTLRLGYQIASNVQAIASGAANADGWTELVGKVTFPSTANDVFIFIDSLTGPSASFYVDEVTLTRIGDIPDVPPPVSQGNELSVFLDQKRQEIDGFQLSGAFRQIDHLLNGFADNPEIQKEVLDLVFGHHTGVDPDTGEPVDPAAKGIGLSIWRNQIADKADLWNYIWKQNGQSWGRWFDSAAFSFRPYAPGDSRFPALAGLPLNAPNLDDASYRWWFDGRDTAAVNWEYTGSARNDTSHIPLATNRWGTARLNDYISIQDNSTTFMNGQAFPGWQVREGGPNANAAFDIFDWPEAPGNQDIVGRNGRSPVDRGQVWASKHGIRYAEARGEEMKIMAAGWSGPAWIKSTGRVNGGNVINAAWALDDYANFLADYVQGWRDIYGIQIWGLSLSNEPEQNNAAYSKSGWGSGTALPNNTGAPSYMPFVRDRLGPILTQRGLRVSTPDGTVNGDVSGVRIHIGDSQSYGTTYQAPFWGNTAERFVDDYVFHNYSWQSTGGSMVDNINHKEWKTRAQINNQGIVMSEISTMAGQTATNIYNYQVNAVRSQNGTQSRSDMGSAMGWAQYYMRQLSILEVSGTGQWWAVGFKRPEANWPMITAPGDQSLENLIYITNDARGNSASATAAGIFRGGLEGATGTHRGITDTSYPVADRTTYATAGQRGGYYTEQTFDYRVHKVFWALGHFCKFARPDWNRVNINQDTINEGATLPNNLNLTTAAFVSPEPDEDGYVDFSIVVLNGTRQNQTLDIGFPGFVVESMERWETREDVIDSNLLTGVVTPGTALTAAQNTARGNFIRGWTDGVRNRDDIRANRVPTRSTDVPSHSGTPHGNNMVLKGEVEAWINGGAVEVPFASMTTFVGRAKVDDGFSTDAASIIPFYNYNELEGAAIFNNSLNLNTPRVETTRIPTRGTGQTGGGGWTQNTGATFTFNRFNFGSGMDTLVINSGGAVTGTETTTGQIPIRVYIGGELATAEGLRMPVTGTAADRTIELVKNFEGINDVVIVLGANGSNVVARLNSLTFLPCEFDNGVITPPSVDTVGYVTYTCERCGCSYDVILAALDGDMEISSEAVITAMNVASGSSWDIVFTVTETHVVNGEAIEFPVDVKLTLTGNNINQSGVVILGRYILEFDIKGNGSNIKLWNVTFNPDFVEEVPEVIPPPVEVEPTVTAAIVGNNANQGRLDIKVTDISGTFTFSVQGPGNNTLVYEIDTELGTYSVLVVISGNRPTASIIDFVEFEDEVDDEDDEDEIEDDGDEDLVDEE